MDIDHRAHSIGGLGSRIIFLGDGTELNSDTADPDSEMFDHDDEDIDLEMQVHRVAVEEGEDEGDAKFSSERSQREGTPAPTGVPTAETGENSGAQAHTESHSGATTGVSAHGEDEGKAAESSQAEGSNEAKTVPAPEGKAAE